MKEKIKIEIKEHIEVVGSVSEMIDKIKMSADVIITSLNNGGTIFFCGNGGSAADSQHLAAEFTGRFKKERRGLSAVALTTDTSAITAIANDYGYDVIFSRQIEALAKSEDVLVAISTSGNSSNVEKAVILSNNIGCKTIGLLGKTGGRLGDLCDIPLVVSSKNTARIQEAHIMIGHIICSLIDDWIDSPTK